MQNPFSWKTSVFLTFGTAAILALGILDARAAAQTQEAESVPALNMPLGDHSTASESALTIVDPGARLSPTPAGELRRLKRLSGGKEASAIAVEEQAADGRQAAAELVVRECEMNGPTGSAPSDVHGAAGLTNIIEVTNVDIMVRNKLNCALVSSMSLKAFFGGAGGFTIPAAESLFDPRVVYDRLHNRCIVTVESRNSGNTDQFLYIASSRTSSCTTWRRVRFVLSRVNPAALFCKNLASDFYDYPNAGYNIRRLVVTSNNFPAAGGSYGTLLSIDKLALHGTTTVTGRCFRPITGNSAPAVQGDTSPHMFILSTGSGAGTVLQRRRLTPGTTPAADTLTLLPAIDIPNWTAPPDAVQPNGQRLDSLDGRFQSASKQIGSAIWNTHAINVGGVSRVRVYKMSTSGIAPLLVRDLFTTSCGSTNQHTFNPSLDTNSALAGSPLFVTTSRTCTSPATVGVGRAAHLIFKGPNHSTAGWVFNHIETSVDQFTRDGAGVACNNTMRGSCRWGDYSSTQIDPSVPTTAWGFNQLIRTGTLGGSQSHFNWRTRAGLVN